MKGRVRIGNVPIDRVTFEGALDEILAMVARGEGGTVVTPNVDHVVLAHENAAFARAYERASLSLVDGMPVLWASRLLGEPLPEKISGSDLVLPLLARAEKKRLRVFFFGGAPGSAEKAREAVKSRFPELVVAGIASPMVRLEDPEDFHAAMADAIKQASPDLVLLGLGAPKQELFAERIRDRVAPAVLLSVGASIDFLAGTVPRAPEWMSSRGLEWLYRLTREPKRLWRRYLLRDPKFLAIVARQRASRRARG